MAGAAIRVGLPPLAAWFTDNGTAYADDERRCRDSCSGSTATVFLSVLDSRRGGSDYEMTRVAPLESLRNDIHVISSIDNAGARSSGPGNGHHKSISGVVSGAAYTGRGAAVHRRWQPPAWRARRDPTRCRSACARSRTGRTSIAT
jgi:hypothetical protein